MDNDYLLISKIRKGICIDYWGNGKCGAFKDIDNSCMYRFVEYDINKGEISFLNKCHDRNLPVFATGYIGYLIKHWGEDVEKINECYFNYRLNEYVELNNPELDSWKRNLRKEFFAKYKKWENGWVKQSESILEFLSDRESEIIKAYTYRYFRYVNLFIKENKNCSGFDIAIKILKQGKKVARKGWNGKGMWLKLAKQNVTGIDKNSFNAIDFENDGLWAMLPCICMKTATGEMLPGWSASQTDMLSEDWVIVE